MTDEPELTVTRWRKYGKDRLYVSTPDGRRVGWHDLMTDRATVELPELADAFARAIAAHPTMTGTTTHLEVDDRLHAPPLETVQDWYDLAGNLPGQAARARADAELTAFREHSKVGAFLARALDVKTDERAWRIGAKGEESVGERLDRLRSDGWRVLHAVPVGRGSSDIDHVLIGHGGVYTVNTKNHPGKRIWVGRNAIKVDGFSVPYLRNSRYEASRAERLLSDVVGRPVPVKAVLVFLTGTLLPDVTIKQHPDDVTILDRMDIPGVFRHAPQRLSADDAAAIYEMARRSTTWTR